MEWYLLNIFIFFLVWHWKNKKNINIQNDNANLFLQHQQKDRNKRMCIVATISWIILSGLRSLSIGADTYAYKIYFFDTIPYTSWNDIFLSFYLKYIGHINIKDPGFMIVEKIFQIFSTDYQLFLLFIAIIFMVPLGVLIYKYSSNPYISYVLYSCLFFSFFSITGLRQTIATALVFGFGTIYIQQRKLFKFILLVAVASTIHASAVAFLPFYWISQIKIKKRSLSIYWGAILCSFVFRESLLSGLQSIVGYEEYTNFEGAGASTFMLLLFLFALLITLFYARLLKRGGVLTSMSMNAIFIACFFSSLLLINQSMMRVVQYYSLFLLFILPEVVNIVDNARDKIIINGLLVIIMVTLLIFTQPEYAFCWQ